jgi:NADH-quinone oxidoreductase subunit C
MRFSKLTRKTRRSPHYAAPSPATSPMPATHSGSSRFGSSARIREAAKVVKDAGYNFLEDVTCVDWYPNEPRFQVTYHILSHGLKQRIRLCALVGTLDPEIASITPVWPSANFYEREIFDLFGVSFAGHPDLRRIMMPDEWQGHPLRKDYPVEGYR